MIKIIIALMLEILEQFSLEEVKPLRFPKIINQNAIFKLKELKRLEVRL
jgi:hypothetical protein